MTSRYNPETLHDGWNTVPDGERFYYTSIPALALIIAAAGCGGDADRSGETERDGEFRFERLEGDGHAGHLGQLA